MHKESEQITNKRNVIAGKMKEINKLQWEKKLDVEKEIIELEHLIQSHNSNLFRIGLLPSSSRLANGENFELSINVEADRIEKIISLDLKDTVRVRYKNKGISLIIYLINHQIGLILIEQTCRSSKRIY